MVHNSHITIAGRRIGPGQRTYIVAELSANHHQRFDEAAALVRAAKECGADAVKLQTYTPDTLTIDCDAEPFRVGAGTLWAGRTLYELYAEASTPWEWQPRLKEQAEAVGLHLFSTPFDRTSVDFLDALGVPAFKIASFELVDLPLLKEVGRRRRPVILSTGMASREELAEAVATLRQAGCDELALLKCTSAYPAPAEEMRLLQIPRLRETFGVPIGLSDHTLDATAAVAAVALGAVIVEKHLTLDRRRGGPDSAFSLEPAEFAALVRAIRQAEAALGAGASSASADAQELGPREAASRQFRRSLFVVAEMAAGEVFTEANVRSIRPGCGLKPKHLDEVLGRRSARAIARGTPLSWDLVA